jgi:ribosomal protein S18 acetylase RimI-like enzyme
MLSSDMNFTLTPLSLLEENGLARLADLHYTVMHTLLADLGLPFVLRYYKIAQTDPSVLAICALAPNNEILGWAMGSPAPASLNARLRQPITWFAAQILHLTLTHPAILIELIRSVLSSLPANAIPAGQVELTYIGVASAARGQGLGTILLTAFMNAARSAGYKSVALSVETDNSAAVTLYTRSGFYIAQTYREGRFERHRMQCELTPA